MTVAELGESSPVYRINKFEVQASGRDEFVDMLESTHAVIRVQEGFVRDVIVERESDGGESDGTNSRRDGDDPANATVQGLGNRKNRIFNDIVSAGVEPFEGSVRFLEAALARGLKVAVVSSSRNAPAVLEAAGLSSQFRVVVDGVRAAAEGLPGKPSPATYEFAATLLGLPSEECVVVEDAVSGVQAGQAGSFHSVIGVDRGAGRQALLDAGATLVVNDLQELLA